MKPKKIKKPKLRVKKVSSREGIIQDLVACKSAFDSVEVSWVIIDGIVLGYVREENVLAWDTDLDIGIFCEISPAKWQELYVALHRSGFNVKNRVQDFVFGRRRVKLNLWLYHKRGKFYEAFPLSTPGIKFVERAKWFDKDKYRKLMQGMHQQ